MNRAGSGEEGGIATAILVRTQLHLEVVLRSLVRA